MYNRLNVEVCNRKKSSKQLTVKQLNETKIHKNYGILRIKKHIQNLWARR